MGVDRADPAQAKTAAVSGPHTRPMPRMRHSSAEKGNIFNLNCYQAGTNLDAACADVRIYKIADDRLRQKSNWSSTGKSRLNIDFEKGLGSR